MSDPITDLIRQVNELQAQVDDLVKPEVPGWADWTPTVTQSVSVAATIIYARYITIGRLVLVECRLAITGTGTAGNAILVDGIPAAIAPVHSGNQADARGTFIIFDASVGWYTGSLYPNSNSNIAFKIDGGTIVGINPNFALANTDRIGFSAAWER